MAPFPHLFSPITVGHLALPNRIMMGSMHTSLEAREDGVERMAAFYAERACGGAALIVTGGFAPNAEGRLGEEPIVFDQARAVSHRAITQAVHRDGGGFYFRSCTAAATACMETSWHRLRSVRRSTG